MSSSSPILRLMFNLNTAMMPAGLCTMGLILFLKKHSQFPCLPPFPHDIYCHKFMLLILLRTIMNDKLCETSNEFWFEAILNLWALEAELGWWTKNWKFGSDKKVIVKTNFKLIDFRKSALPKIVLMFFLFPYFPLVLRPVLHFWGQELSFQAQFFSFWIICLLWTTSKNDSIKHFQNCLTIKAFLLAIKMSYKSLLAIKIELKSLSW